MKKGDKYMSLKNVILLFMTAGAVLSGCSKEDASVKEGRDLLKNEDYEGAVNFFKEVLANDKTNQAALVGIVDAFIGLESYAEAVECLDYMTDLETVNQYSEKIYSVYDPLYDAVKEGMELLESQDYEGAIAFFEEFLSNNEQNDLAMAGIVDALIAVEDYGKALDYVAMMTDSQKASEYTEKINEVYHPIDESLVQSFLENFVDFIRNHNPLTTSYTIEENTYEAQSYFALIAARQLAENDGFPDFECNYSVDEINEMLSEFLGDKIQVEQGSHLESGYLTWSDDLKKFEYNIYFPTYGGCELVDFTIDTKNSLITASVIHHHYYDYHQGDPEAAPDFGPNKVGVYLNNELVGVETFNLSDESGSFYQRIIEDVEYNKDENDLITHQYTFSYDDNSEISLIGCEVY